MTVQQYEGDGGTVGLEDVGVGDLVLPRLQIVHDEGRFRDNLSKQEYDVLDAIFLGLVKQRILWHDTVDEGDKPMCKSPDFEHGFPNVDDDTPKNKRFPWDTSNFNPADFPPSNGIGGLVTLPCASCSLKEWGDDRQPPPCAEQHTFPILYNINSGQDGVEPIWTAALFTTQKTGIKPSRQYISSFAQSRQPMFTVVTRLSLTQQSRGTVKFSVPRFQRLGASDSELWSEYAEQYVTIRDYIRQPPRAADDDVAAPSGNENTAPAAASSRPRRHRRRLPPQRRRLLQQLLRRQRPRRPPRRVRPLRQHLQVGVETTTFRSDPPLEALPRYKASLPRIGGGSSLLTTGDS